MAFLSTYYTQKWLCIKSAVLGHLYYSLLGAILAWLFFSVVALLLFSVSFPGGNARLLSKQQSVTFRE